VLEKFMKIKKQQARKKRSSPFMPFFVAAAEASSELVVSFSLLMDRLKNL